MYPNSVKNTAFVTPHALFEFQVMSFGLTNAPGVFQRLMERVLAGLNPEDRPDYVVVYIDNVLVFLRTLEDHLEYLREVIWRIPVQNTFLVPAGSGYYDSLYHTACRTEVEAEQMSFHPRRGGISGTSGHSTRAEDKLPIHSCHFCIPTATESA